MPVLWYAFVDCRHRIFKGGLGGGGEVGGAKAPPPAAPSPSLKGASHASLGTIAHTKYAMILKVPY